MAQKIYSYNEPCKKARVEMYSVKGSFKAYIENRRWNGWAVVWLTKEEGLRFVKANAAVKGNEPLSYWPSKDAFVERGSEGGYVMYRPNLVQTVDGVKKLYPLGDGWCWDIAKLGW